MDRRISAALAAAIFGTTAAVAAQPPTPKPPEGPSANTRGPGMMGGYGRGHGWGGGMMGGGMMGWGGGWGGGMMEGYGPGWGGGMMGWGPHWGGADLNLSGEQRDKITAIQRDLRNKQFTLMDKMHDQFGNGDLYRGGKFDEQAARRAYETAEKLHRQMFENMLDARKRMDAVLTPQQRQQLGQDRQ